MNNFTGIKTYNYPNPFNISYHKKGFATKIYFSNPKNQNIEISIFNIKGQKIVTLLDKQIVKGDNFIVWDGKDNKNNSVSSGVYFYQIKSKNMNIIHKMLLLK